MNREGARELKQIEIHRMNKGSDDAMLLKHFKVIERGISKYLGNCMSQDNDVVTAQREQRGRDGR